MMSYWIKRGRLLVLLFIVSSVFWGCTSARTISGVIQHTEAIDSKLRVGVSTMAEVRAILGDPNGYGGARLPPDPRPHEIWFYHLIKTNAVRAAGDSVLMDVQMEMLQVFFLEGIYDGHMWFKD
jgi:hypothetical protein